MIELLIEIEWSGALSCEEMYHLRDPKKDFGLYCIYGNHAVSGPETLLYIGKACDQTFATRFLQHSGWLNVECSDLKVYIGKIGSSNPQYSNQEWTSKIVYAENLLIHYLSPPYNTTCIYKHPTTPKTLILNLHKRNRLPYCITSVYYDHDFYKHKELWKLYDFKEE